MLYGSTFYTYVDQGKITGKVTISATTVTGTFIDTDGTQKSFVATLPGSNYDPSTTLEPKLQATWALDPEGALLDYLEMFYGLRHTGQARVLGFSSASRNTVIARPSAAAVRIAQDRILEKA